MDNVTYLGVLLPRFITELVAAILCGALLGIERGPARRSAGLRDTILICFGTTLLMIVGELLDLATGDGSATDPGRLAGWVIGAAGLIAAGAALRRRGAEALTTAATIWVTAGVGLLIGAGYPLLGLLVTGAVLLTLMLLRGIETHLTGHPRPLLLKLTAREDSPELRRQIQAVLERQGVYADSFRAESAPGAVKLTVTAASEPADVRPLVAALWTVPGVTEVEH